MNTAVINIKVSPDTKRKARAVAEELGFSLSGLINGYLKQLVKTKTVVFSAHPEQPTKFLLRALKESDKDIKAGKIVHFSSKQGALGYLDKIIANDKRSRGLDK